MRTIYPKMDEASLYQTVIGSMGHGKDFGFGSFLVTEKQKTATPQSRRSHTFGYVMTEERKQHYYSEAEHQRIVEENNQRHREETAARDRKIDQQQMQISYLYSVLKMSLPMQNVSILSSYAIFMFSYLLVQIR
jgi:hypothetical protein